MAMNRHETGKYLHGSAFTFIFLAPLTLSIESSVPWLPSLKNLAPQNPTRQTRSMRIGETRGAAWVYNL